MEVVLKDKKKGIKALLYYRNFSIFLTANTISRFGDAIDAIAYGWMVYILTGSKLLLGTLLAVNALPNIILGPFAGVLADRFNKKKLIILSYTVRGIIVLITAFLYKYELLRPVHLFIFTIANSTMETIMSPATISILPAMIKKEDMLSANSVSSSIYRLFELIGTGVAGIFIGLLGIWGAILIDSITFFSAALLMTLIAYNHIKIEDEGLNVKSYLRDLKEGFMYLKNNYIIRLTIIMFAAINFCLSPINVLMTVFAKDILKGGPEVLSLMGMAFAIGSILGGLLMGIIGSRYKISTLLIFGMLLFGIDYALLSIPGHIIVGNLASIITASSMFLIFGLLIPVMVSPITTYIMTNTKQELLGRIAAFIMMINYCAIPLGTSITGIATQYISVPIIFLVMGVTIILLSTVLYFNKEFRKN